MPFFEKEELNERYMDLVGAVVYQACYDYARVLKAKDPHHPPERCSAYKFLMDPDNMYLDALGIDGDCLVNKIKKNQKMYGNGMPKEPEWAKIRKMLGVEE